MSQQSKAKIGEIAWRDLTVENAEEVQHFYRDVVGWETKPHAMGDYHDYDVRVAETGEVVAGICHARGDNASLPPQWLIYVQVESVATSAQRCEERGGKVVDGPRSMGDLQFCVIRDPAGAYLALVSS